MGNVPLVPDRAVLLYRNSLGEQSEPLTNESSFEILVGVCQSSVVNACPPPTQEAMFI